MQYSQLIARIQADIYNNGAQLITGNVLQGDLLAMVNALASSGAGYGGIITPDSSAPASLDQATFYIAIQPGTYSSFGVTVTEPSIVSYGGGASLTFTVSPLGLADAIIVNNLTTDDATKALSAAQGVVLDGEISRLGQEIIDNATFSVPLSGTWRQGSIDVGHNYTNGMRTRAVIAIPYTGDISFSITEGYYAAVHSFSVVYEDINQDTAGDGYIGSLTNGGWVSGDVRFSQPSGGKTYVIIIKKGSGSGTDIGPSDGPIAIPMILGYVQLKDSIVRLNNTVYGKQYTWQNDAPDYVWRQGSIDVGREYLPTMNTRIVTAIPWTGDLSITVANGYYISVHAYSVIYEDIVDDTQGNGYLENISNGWASGSVSLSQPSTGKTYVIIIKKGSAGTDTISPTDASTAITSLTGTDVYVEGIKETVDKLVEDTDNYVYGTDFIKRTIRINELGSLKYLQAFCVYNGKYYSTDGTHIAEQDSSFTVLRDVSINVGHGNSLQLVSGGIAWASGWDDQTMYKVDLSTLTVIQTITLPTTGYTTVAVDEVGGLMYIFQRSSYPSTVENYNFIKYDYINEQIISTRVIDGFAAMQSIDYYCGRILMLYGLGTAVAPSGMRIYNTVGDVISLFDIAAFRSTEPEGIMFERDSQHIFVSDVNKKIYIIE